jgi:hypothetical protein
MLLLLLLLLLQVDSSSIRLHVVEDGPVHDTHSSDRSTAISRVGEGPG